MKLILIWACMILQVSVVSVKSDEGHVRRALLEFIAKLSDSSNSVPHPLSGWNSSSYPCQDRWKGITCDDQHRYVEAISLSGLNFSGILDAALLCNVQSLSASLLVVNVSSNSIHGENLEDIRNCSQLTHLLVSWNQFSGIIPKSFSQLKNLKVLDVSHNKFSGPLPDEFPGNLMVFLAQDNQFSGAIPSFDFSSVAEFNVSYNNLGGLIPAGVSHFNASSFIHNPRLCGLPLPDNCTSIVVVKDSEPAPVPPPKPGKSGTSRNQMLIFAGYILMGLVVLFAVILCLYKRIKVKQEKLDADNKVAALDDSISFSSVELKAGRESKSNFTTSAESAPVSASLTVLTSPEVNGLRFEDLLKAPAELLGRANHGSMYKVAYHGINLAVKRVKDWPISSNEFRQRMRRLSQVRHPNVLPVIAFYSSTAEKLLVYEYQDNMSLFSHIHGDRRSQPLGWSSRISAAATIANALAFMHEELQYDGIPHGNIKSSNILLNTEMEACISEYGLMHVENQGQAAQDGCRAPFKADTYAFGVILLELLTGRRVLNDGWDLATWVVTVLREEWTAEVFDQNLLQEAASEERMVSMLQVAIQCINKSPEARPHMRQVASAITAIKDDEELSMDVSDLSITRSSIDL